MTTPADYYAAKAAEARRLAVLLCEAMDRNAPEDEIRRIERQLEAARYVGD